MRCYRHEDREAIGICSLCGRACCKPCSVTQDERLYCGPGCADEGEQCKTSLDWSLANAEKQRQIEAEGEHCVFCRRPKKEVFWLVQGPGQSCIGDACVELAKDNLDWQRFQTLPAWKKVWVRLFGRRLRPPADVRYN